MSAEHGQPLCWHPIGDGARCQRPVAHADGHSPRRDHPDDLPQPPSPPRSRYVIRRNDGTIEDRASGTVIGRVYRWTDGWHFDAAVDVDPAGLWTPAEGGFNSRQRAAQTLYAAWRQRVSHQDPKR